MLLPEGDAAFVGTYLGQTIEVPMDDEFWTSGHPVVNHFAIEKVIKGDLGPVVDVVTAISAVSCGLELQSGQRIGLVINSFEGGWYSSRCWQTDADEMMALAPDAGPEEVPPPAVPPPASVSPTAPAGGDPALTTPPDPVEDSGPTEASLDDEAPLAAESAPPDRFLAGVLAVSAVLIAGLAGLLGRQQLRRRRG